MIKNAAPQHSTEWFDLRYSMVTASNAAKILTPSTLKYSKQASTFAAKIAAFKVWGIWDEPEPSFAMTRGIELEPDARAAYMKRTGLESEECGLCLNNSRTAGATPDGMIYSGEDLVGINEFKCPNLDNHLAYLVADRMPIKYSLQVQFQLWITEAEWCDFASYYPGLPLMIDRIFPEKIMHGAISEAVESFNSDVEETVKLFRSMK